MVIDGPWIVGQGAPWWPFLLVLMAYYVNGAAFLAFSSTAERTGSTIDDGRSLSFLGGLAEGAATVVVYSLWLLLPAIAWQIALVWVAGRGVELRPEDRGRVPGSFLTDQCPIPARPAHLSCFRVVGTVLDHRQDPRRHTHRSLLLLISHRLSSD